MAVPAKIHEAAQPKPPKKRRLKIARARKERRLTPWEACALQIIREDAVTAPSLAAPEQLVAGKARYDEAVIALAARLAKSFKNGEFDNSTNYPADPPFMTLESICEHLPICADRASAAVVFLSSAYAPRAARNLSECPCDPAKLLSVLAGFCLSRDVHDAAIAHGWSTMKERRGMP